LNQLTILTQINLDDLVASFGWQDQPLLAATLRGLFHQPARNKDTFMTYVCMDASMFLPGVLPCSSRTIPA
jgi:hypothetical protein